MVWLKRSSMGMGVSAAKRWRRVGVLGAGAGEAGVVEAVPKVLTHLCAMRERPLVEVEADVAGTGTASFLVVARMAFSRLLARICKMGLSRCSLISGSNSWISTSVSIRLGLVLDVEEVLVLLASSW